MFYYNKILVSIVSTYSTRVARAWLLIYLNEGKNQAVALPLGVIRLLLAAPALSFAGASCLFAGEILADCTSLCLGGSMLDDEGDLTTISGKTSSRGGC